MPSDNGKQQRLKINTLYVTAECPTRWFIGHLKLQITFDNSRVSHMYGLSGNIRKCYKTHIPFFHELLLYIITYLICEYAFLILEKKIIIENSVLISLYQKNQGYCTFHSHYYVCWYRKYLRIWGPSRHAIDLDRSRCSIALREKLSALDINIIQEVLSCQT